MTVSITTFPTYPVPGRPVKLTFSVAATANYVKLHVTNAPDGSEFRQKLDKLSASRIQIYEGDSSAPSSLTFDVAGAYTFTAEELFKGSATTGGYAGAPQNDPGETLIGSNTVTIYIGQRLTQQIGAGNDTATLVVYVFNNTTRETLLDVHGEASPAIIEPKTPKAEGAANSTLVVNQLLSIRDQTSSSLLGDLGATIDNLMDKYELHRQEGGVHASNDTTNTIATSFLNPNGLRGFATGVTEFHKILNWHMTNANGSNGPATASSAYHTNMDQENAALVRSADEKTLDSLWSATAAAWIAYEDHRQEGTPVHSSADATNSATTPTLLFALHVYFLQYLAAESPTAPSNENPGSVALVSYGFQKG